MTVADGANPASAPAVANGSGAAAVLAAGIGAFALAVLAFAGDKSALVKKSLIFYAPTGPLSGVTTVAILIWILAWCILEWRWRAKSVAMGRINLLAFALLGFSLLMTFPPFADLF